MHRCNILIGISVAILTFSIWAYLNRPEQEPAWPKRIQGFSFSPFRPGQSPLLKSFPSEKEIDEDLALLAGKTHAIRTYTMESTLARITELAKKYKINVTLGAWLDTRLDNNEMEVKGLIRVASKNTNVVRLIVGNEVILRKDMPPDKLIQYIEHVRREVNGNGGKSLPISTAEPWHIWLKNPELVEHVDFLSVQMLPFWEGIQVDNAVDYIVQRINEVKARFPKKPIVISEVGWPSNGRTRKSAVASESNEAAFLRRFIDRAQQEKYVFYIMEAFDQPWKRNTEGAAGAYWGVYDADRKPKFPFTEPIVPIPAWHMLAAISVVIAACLLALLFIDSMALKRRGRGFLAIIAFAAATLAVWIIYDYIQQYLTLTTVAVGILMLLGMIGVILILLTEAHEWAEALWVTGRRRELKFIHLPDNQLPKVSIHVPAYNEPPDMMKETLDALAQLDYPDFEVILIDNNTKDPNVWKPVEAHCAKLGPRFRFFHVDPLSGFKSGALNYALQNTAENAQIIAVIDSDYTVKPNWLKDLVPQFQDPLVGLVQAPQDYRDEMESAFKAMCFAEYRAFFYIGMVTRNERNAIIQHGTMTMVRRSMLEKVGGWAEWCITEDAELGLRLFEHGYTSLYIAKTYGKGLMPDSYDDYKKQRFRWAYGAIQILRRHFGELVGRKKTELRYGQRYHFLAGWMPWIADSANLLFNIGAVMWSVAMILFPKSIDPPLLELSFLPIALFSFKTVKMIYLYRTRMKAKIRQTIAAGLAGLALSHTIARAVLTGFITRNKPFFRTPKLTGKPMVIQAIGSVTQEWCMLVLLIGSAVGVSARSLSVTLDLRVWIIVLLMQSIPYIASVLVAFISGFSGLPPNFVGGVLGRTES